MRWDAHEYTEVAGTRMHAAALGADELPEVIGVHGLSCSHRYFAPFARALVPHARCVVPDLPGFGWTPGTGALDIPGLAEALAQWLETTGRQRSVLVGNSMGCQIAVEVAARFPELVAGLVLNGPTMERGARSGWRQLMRMVASAPLESPTLGLVLARDYLDCGFRRLWATFHYALAHEIERALPEVDCPALVVRGRHDKVCTASWADTVVELLPDGELAEVPRASHTLNYSSPTELALATRGLMDRARSSKMVARAGKV